MKKLLWNTAFLFLTSILLGSLGVQAQSIFENPIIGTNPNTANPYTAGQIVDPNLTVSGIGRGPGINGTNANNRYNANGWNSSGFDSTDYFEFVLTPNAGYKIDFVSFVYTGQASGTGPSSFAFRSSVDGFSTDIGTPTATGATISLALPQFQVITAPITFRLYAWGASAATGTYSVNTFTFNGEVSLDTGCNQITGQPSSKTSYITLGTSFEVTALNATGFQWQVDTGGGFVNVTNGGVYSGATTSTLTLNNLPKTFDGYEYRCIVSGSCADEISGIASLSVLSPSNPTPHILANGNYSFTAWNSASPAGTYPPNMAFWTRNVNDAPLNTPFIGDWFCSYNIGNRSRFQGQNDLGVSMVNTGNAQANSTCPDPSNTDTDIRAGRMGAVVLALNTVSKNDIEVRWTGRTIAPNNRVYAIRFQYRVGDGGGDPNAGWNDLPTPVEYVRNETALHSQDFVNVLPAVCDNQPLVQLRWQYYWQSVTGENRAELAVDDIIVSTVGCAISDTNTFRPTTGVSGTVVTVTGTNLLGATAIFNGVPMVVLSTTATTMEVVIPDGAVTGTLTTITSGGCPVSSPYTIIPPSQTSCQGAPLYVPTDLFISEVTDSNNGGLSYIEIYNGTGAVVNLSNYSLRIFNNGSSTVNANINLVGTIANGGVYIVQVGTTSCPGPFPPTNLVFSGVGGINFPVDGHDHIGLFNGATKIDSWGVFEASNWAPAFIGDRGATFRRKTNPTTPAPTVNYSNDDWDIINYPGTACAANDYSDVGGYNFINTTTPIITVQPNYTPSCNVPIVLQVQAEEGFPGGNPLVYRWYVNTSTGLGWTQLNDSGNYSGTQTNTLTITPGAFNNFQYYCRVAENNLSTCFVPSNSVQIKTVQSTTWNGTTWLNGAPTATGVNATISGNYDTALHGSFECCNLTVGNTRTLTISDGDYVYVENNITINGTTGTLHVQNNGSLIQNNPDGVTNNNGRMRLTRTTTPFKRFDYVYWSSPLTEPTISGTFTGWTLNRAYRFVTPNFVDLDNDTFDDGPPWAWQQFTGTMIPGEGYAIMVPGSGTFPRSESVLFDSNQATGNPNKFNNGTITRPLFFSGNTLDDTDDYNLVGNPYPSALNADDFINENIDRITGTLLFWTHVAEISLANPGPDAFNHTANDYAYYNLSGGTASATGSTVPTGLIGSAQGFIVIAEDTSTPLVFNNNMRDKFYDNSDFYRMSSETQSIQGKDRFWLNLENPEGVFSQQLIGYFPMATYGYDPGFDAVYTPTMSYAAFYSMMEGTPYRIQGRGTFDPSDVIPLGYKTVIPGSFTISINHSEGLFQGISVYLEDTLLNQIHDLTAGPYVFVTETGTFTNRFILRYTNETLSVTNPVTLQSTVGVISKNEELSLLSSVEPMSAVVVYDVLGRQLYHNNTLAGTLTHMITSVMATHQTLLVKITFSNGQSLVKKVIH